MTGPKAKQRTPRFHCKCGQSFYSRAAYNIHRFVSKH